MKPLLLTAVIATTMFAAITTPVLADDGWGYNSSSSSYAADCQSSAQNYGRPGYSTGTLGTGYRSTSNHRGYQGYTPSYASSTNSFSGSGYRLGSGYRGNASYGRNATCGSGVNNYGVGSLSNNGYGNTRNYPSSSASNYGQNQYGNTYSNHHSLSHHRNGSFAPLQNAYGSSSSYFPGRGY